MKVGLTEIMRYQMSRTDVIPNNDNDGIGVENHIEWPDSMW